MTSNEPTDTAPAPESEGDAGVPSALRGWLGLAVLVLPILLIALDNSVLFLATPHLAADLRPGPLELLWILDIYGFMIAGLLVTMGGLADRIGSRRLLMIGAAAFGLASVLAAYAPSAELLIAARALLGVAGATMMPSTLSLVSSLFRDPRQRGLAIGIWTAFFSGGTIVGPIVGGALLESYWWGSVFLLGVPVMVLLLVAAPILLPESRRRASVPLDLTSVLLSLAAMLPLVYGLKELAKDGLAPAPVLAIVVGAGAGALFVRRQLRLEHPLLDMALFRNRAFSTGLFVLLTGMAIIGGLYLFFTQYLQLVVELSPLRAGLWMVPAAVGEMAIAVVTPLIARRVRPAYVVGTGLATSALGLLLISRIGVGTELLVLVTAVTIVFIGTSPMIVLNTDLVVAAAPPGKGGSAASMLETSGELGVAIGVAAFGSIGGAVYRDQLTDSLPSGVDPQAATSIGESLHGATVAARGLPSGSAGPVLESAREAFGTSLQVVAGVGALLAIGLAVLAISVLRNVRPDREAEPDEPAEQDDRDRPQPVAGAGRVD